MKFIGLILLFCSVSILNIALAQDTVKISGRISNPVSDSILLTYNTDRIAYYPIDIFTTLDNAGRFSFKFQVPKGVYTQAEIKYGNSTTDIIVRPGDSVMMTGDTKYFDSTRSFKGRGSVIQNYISKHARYIGRMNQYMQRTRKCMTKEPEEFIKCIDDEKDIEMQFLKEFGKELPASFRQYWMAYYVYYNYYFMEQYPMVHEMMKKRRFTDTIPDINYSVLKNMPLAFYDTLLQVPPYLLYLGNAIETKLKASGFTYHIKDTASLRKVQDSVMKLTWTTMPDQSAEYYTAQSIYSKIRYRDIAVTKQQFDKFKKRWGHSEYIPTMAKQVEIAERVSPGQPAPDITIMKVDGSTMKLSDLKGKVVLVNFWWTNSRQSFSDMVTEEKIRTLMKDKPLEFLHISIQDDTANINGLLKRYKLSGIFGYLHGGWYAEEIKAFGVQGLPAYYLIDEDGKFALQNTPTPDQYTELLLEIEKLMK